MDGRGWIDCFDGVSMFFFFLQMILWGFYVALVVPSQHWSLMTNCTTANQRGGFTQDLLHRTSNSLAPLEQQTNNSNNKYKNSKSELGLTVLLRAFRL